MSCWSDSAPAPPSQAPNNGVLVRILLEPQLSSGWWLVVPGPGRSTSFLSVCWCRILPPLQKTQFYINPNRFALPGGHCQYPLYDAIRWRVSSRQFQQYTLQRFCTYTHTQIPAVFITELLYWLYLVINLTISAFLQMMLTLLAFVLSTLAFFVLCWMNGQRQRRNFPPGPKKYPFIGNLLSMPSALEWETFAKWGKEYSPYGSRLWSSVYLMLCLDSDIIHVNALGTSMIILNSYKVATDLLDQRSSTYSSRWVVGLNIFFGVKFTEILPCFN